MIGINSRSNVSLSLRMGLALLSVRQEESRSLLGSTAGKIKLGFANLADSRIWTRMKSHRFLVSSLGMADQDTSLFSRLHPLQLWIYWPRRLLVASSRPQQELRLICLIF